MGEDTVDRRAANLEPSRDLSASEFLGRIIVAAANARVKAWLEGTKAGFDANRAGWKKNRRLHLLNTGADDAEAYGAVFDLAAAAADEAAQAALQALLARNDANIAALPEGWASHE